MIQAAILKTPEQTAAEMERLTRKFSGDIRYFRMNGTPLNELPLDHYYRVIAEIPYKRDLSGIEVVTRPYLVLSGKQSADCKKKAILISSYLQNNGIPYRFKAVSSRKNGELHHVIVEAKINGKWIEIDATYPKNQLFQKVKWTNAKLLSGGEITSFDSPILVSLYGEGNPSREMINQYHKSLGQIYRGLNTAEYPGVSMGIASEAVAAIVTAIVAAVASVTISIVSAVSSRKSEERAAASQKAQNDFAQALYLQQVQDQKDANESARIERAEYEKKLITYGLIGAVGFGIYKLI